MTEPAHTCAVNPVAVPVALSDPAAVPDALVAAAPAATPTATAGAASVGAVARGWDPVVLLRVSVVVAVLTIVLKTAAWWMTDSVGLLSDALESFVNLAGAVFALLMVTVARRPADRNHPYGHTKAEYFSAGFEGILIVGAALGIIWAAVLRLLNPAPLQELGWGLGLAIVSSALNGVLGWVMLRSARAHASKALEADARHLFTDVWTSAGVVVALLAVGWTGWLWLDGVIAIAVALNILKEGVGLVWEASRGLMDEALDDAQLRELQAVLDRHAAAHAGAVYFDALATRRAGQSSFVQAHLHVPAHWSIGCCARLRMQVEQELMQQMPGLHVTLEILPHDAETAREASRSKPAAVPPGV